MNVCWDVSGRALNAAFQVFEYCADAASEDVVVRAERWRRLRMVGRVEEKKEGWDGRVGGVGGNMPRFNSLSRKWLWDCNIASGIAIRCVNSRE